MRRRLIGRYVTCRRVKHAAGRRHCRDNDGPLAKVRNQRQKRAPSPVPGDVQGRLVDDAPSPGMAADPPQARRDLARPQREQPAIAPEPCGMSGLLEHRPIEDRAGERRLGLRIGNALARSWILEPCRSRELRAAVPRAPRRRGRRRNRRRTGRADRRPDFLAHEQQRRRRREQRDRAAAWSASRGTERDTALAERVVADLIVVLQEMTKAESAADGRWLAAFIGIAKRRCFALIGEALCQRPAELVRRPLGIIGVIAAD